MISKHETKSVACDLKSVEADGTFSGYASRFHVADLGRDLVLPGAFRESLTKRVVVQDAFRRLMWALIVARLAELALAVISVIKSVSAAILQWQAVDLGETKGRAESDAAHAEAARRAGERMQTIADQPETRDEIIKRLEEGSA